MAEPTIPAIDVWAQPGTAALLRRPEFASLPRAVGRRAPAAPRGPVEAGRALDRAVRELGLKGLFVLPWMWDLPPNDRHYYPLYVKCVELGVPFCCQAGHTGPMRHSEPGRPIPYLDEGAP